MNQPDTESLYKRLKMLRQLDQAILAARSPEEIAQVALDHIWLLIPTRRASVILFDLQKQEFTALGVRSNVETHIHIGSRYPLEDEIETLRRGEIYSHDDLLTITDPSPLVQALQTEGIRAYINVPMIARGELIGSLNLGIETPGPLSAEHAKIAREVAYSMAVVVQQARLVEQMGQEITERKRMEGTLRESEERYRAIFKQAPDSILLIDTETGTIVGFNDKAHESLGYTREEFGKLKIPDIEVIESPEDVEKHIAKVLQTGMDTFKTKHRTKGGEIRDIWVSTRVISLGGKNFLQSVCRDNTERVFAEERTTRSQRTLLALSNAAQAVQRARTPEDVFHTIGDEVSGLGFNVTIFTLTADQSHLSLAHTTFAPLAVKTAEKLTGLSARNYRFPLVSGGFYKQLFDQGKTVYTEGDFDQMLEILPSPLHPLLDKVIALLDIKQSIVTPLTISGELFGIIAVTGSELTEADVPAVTAFANQASIAIENAILLDQVRSGRERLQLLSQQLLEVQEAERRHIARELHDEIGQLLTGLNLLLGMSVTIPADELRSRLGEARTLVEELMERTDDLSLDLRPAMLDDLGLLSALLWHIERYTVRTGVDIDLEHSGLERRFPTQIESAAYRVVQEALTNVARHADVNETTVRLWADQETLSVQVEDRGVGFDPQTVLIAGSVSGLSGMRERVSLLGGQLTIEAAPGQGTRLMAEWYLSGTPKRRLDDYHHSPRR